jgi:hypothetical protein
MTPKGACLYLSVSTATKSQHDEAAAFDLDPAAQREWNLTKIPSDDAKMLAALDPEMLRAVNVVIKNSPARTIPALGIVSLTILAGAAAFLVSAGLAWLSGGLRVSPL